MMPEGRVAGRATGMILLTVMGKNVSAGARAFKGKHTSEHRACHGRLARPCFVRLGDMRNVLAGSEQQHTAGQAGRGTP